MAILLAGDRYGHGQTFLNLLAPSLSSFSFLKLLDFSRRGGADFMSQIFQLGIIMFPTGLRERIIVDTEALQRKHSKTMARLLEAKMNPFCMRNSHNDIRTELKPIEE